MLLVCACSLCVWMVIVIFLRNKSFLKILLSGEYEKLLVSRNLRLNFRVSNFNSCEFWVFFHFCLITHWVINCCCCRQKLNNSCKGDFRFREVCSSCHVLEVCHVNKVTDFVVVVVEWAPGNVPRAPNFLF